MDNAKIALISGFVTVVVLSISLLFSHFLNIIQILVPTIIPTAEMINAGTAISISSIV